MITRDQIPLIGDLAGIARGTDGRPLVSPELSQVVNLLTKADGTDANAQLRGVGPNGLGAAPAGEDDRRAQVQPRPARAGRRPGRASDSSAGLEVGKQVELANQLWTVVGIFASGDSHDSELWADSETVANTYQRYRVPVGDGKARRQGRLRAAQGRDGRRSRA